MPPRGGRTYGKSKLGSKQSTFSNDLWGSPPGGQPSTASLWGGAGGSPGDIFGDDIFGGQPAKAKASGKRRHQEKRACDVDLDDIFGKENDPAPLNVGSAQAAADFGGAIKPGAAAEKPKKKKKKLSKKDAVQALLDAATSEDVLFLADAISERSARSLGAFGKGVSIPPPPRTWTRSHRNAFIALIEQLGFRAVTVGASMVYKISTADTTLLRRLVAPRAQAIRGPDRSALGALVPSARAGGRAALERPSKASRTPHSPPPPLRRQLSELRLDFDHLNLDTAAKPQPRAAAAPAVDARGLPQQPVEARTPCGADAKRHSASFVTPTPAGVGADGVECDWGVSEAARSSAIRELRDQLRLGGGGAGARRAHRGARRRSSSSSHVELRRDLMETLADDFSPPLPPPRRATSLPEAASPWFGAGAAEDGARLGVRRRRDALTSAERPPRSSFSPSPVAFAVQNLESDLLGHRRKRPSLGGGAPAAPAGRAEEAVADDAWAMQLAEGRRHKKAMQKLRRQTALFRRKSGAAMGALGALGALGEEEEEDEEEEEEEELPEEAGAEPFEAEAWASKGRNVRRRPKKQAAEQAVAFGDFGATRPWSRFVERNAKGAMLGSGAYKDVYKVVRREQRRGAAGPSAADAAVVAVSVVDLKEIEGIGAQSVVAKEVEALRALSLSEACEASGLFLRLLDAYRCRRRPALEQWDASDLRGSAGVEAGRFQFLETEFCDLGDLEQLMRRRPAKALSLPETRSALFQMIAAVAVAQRHCGLRHYDIKLLNFFACTRGLSGRAAPPRSISVGGVDYEVPPSRIDVRLADFGTADVSEGGAAPAAAPVDVEHLTTLENAPVEFLALGNRALQGFHCDAFSLGLAVLHLFSGHGPYEELLAEVCCPAELRRELAKLWEKKPSSSSEDYFEPLRCVIRADGDDSGVLYHTLYRYLVLFGLPDASDMDEDERAAGAKVWNAVDKCLGGYDAAAEASRPTRRGKKCAAEFAEHRQRFSLWEGTSDVMKAARRRIAKVPGAEDALRGLLRFSPRRRMTAEEALRAVFASG